jgi:hypothetical protein
MNRQEQYDEDLLRNYLNPEKIERAPEGFTSKTLTRIQIETQSKKGIKTFLVRNRVPLISVVVTAGLIFIALMLPSKETDVVGSAILKFFRNIEFTLPQIRLTDLKDLNLPGWISYAYLVILLLAFIDWALFGVFHRSSK